DAGADDYVTKPFGMEELLARMRAAIRRTGPVADEPVIEFGGLVIDLAAKTVTRAGGEAIRLTPTEWHLLEVLLRNPAKLLTQRQLLTEVWGPGYADASGNLRLYMAQLRRKLEPDPARPRWLMTEPGMGYRDQTSPDGDHCRFVMELLGQDEHGWWLFGRRGMTLQRGAEPEFRRARDFALLVPAEGD